MTRAIICPECGFQRDPDMFSVCPECADERARIRQLKWEYKRMDTRARRQRYRPKKRTA